MLNEQQESIAHTKFMQIPLVKNLLDKSYNYSSCQILSNPEWKIDSRF